MKSCSQDLLSVETMKHIGPNSSAKPHSILSEIQHASSEISRQEPQLVQNAQQYASLSFSHTDISISSAWGGGRFLCKVLKDLVKELRVVRMGLFVSGFFSNACWHWALHSKKTVASILNKALLYFQIRVVSHSNIASKRERGRQRMNVMVVTG